MLSVAKARDINSNLRNIIGETRKGPFMQSVLLYRISSKLLQI